MSIADETEQFLRALSEPDADPRPRECLVCYVARRLRVRACDHRRLWTLRFRDLRSPRATSLEHRLWTQGVRCDCDLFHRNGFRVTSGPLVRDLLGTRPAGHDEQPACDGVHRTSTRPCALWEKRPRWDPWPPPEEDDTAPPF
ncbi:DUF2695 domain-containing protein [Nocardioides lianchengensis]|uniref:DUF2695 domain-containing protein n=1 Tax=Nocardioides lianchengensis TaxID=1045774 RepID=A0A1G6VCD4_9ACTN|nr:DUF2695 domain-containing protein [Nocardioides lianchengensis]NYG11223.1 hypothetical protein [Nocardioides lianchengensis]SDD51053.1 Protein of unknown function [Nocardioides lianchengensis]